MNYIVVGSGTIVYMDLISTTAHDVVRETDSTSSVGLCSMGPMLRQTTSVEANGRQQ